MRFRILLLPIIPLLLLLPGCTTESPTAASIEADEAPLQADALSESFLGKSHPDLSADQKQQLAQLRRLVAPFHNFEKAEDAGWNVQFTPCLSHPTEGAMGYHYGNPAFVDGDATVLEPELLLYEPQKNGRLRFVGVEYIIPFDILGPESEPPTLLGQEFHQVPDAGLWGLHVWVGRHNPSGLFADWNPEVTCEYAED